MAENEDAGSRKSEENLRSHDGSQEHAVEDHEHPPEREADEHHIEAHVDEEEVKEPPPAHEDSGDHEHDLVEATEDDAPKHEEVEEEGGEEEGHADGHAEEGDGEGVTDHHTDDAGAGEEHEEEDESRRTHTEETEVREGEEVEREEGAATEEDEAHERRGDADTEDVEDGDKVKAEHHEAPLKESVHHEEHDKVAVFAEDIKQVTSVTIIPTRDPNESDEATNMDTEEVSAFEKFTLVHSALDQSAEKEEMPLMTRDDLLKSCHDAKLTNKHLTTSNEVIQHKLAEHFMKRKRSVDQQMANDKNAPDPEQMFIKYLAKFEELGTIYSRDRERAIVLLQAGQEQSATRKRKVDIERMKFLEYKKQVALKSVGRQSGKPVPPKDVEMAVIREEQRERDLITIRLEYLRLKYKLRRQKQELKTREEFAEGLHLFDFELLKIENETCNEKIEERNEELHKLRKKSASTVQILTHLKEKLKSVQRENLAKKTSLKEVETGLCQSRQSLSRTKHARDVLRKDNQSLGYKSGLMGHGGILMDLERSVDKKRDLLNKVEELKVRHKTLVERCYEVKRITATAKKASIRAYSISMVKQVSKHSSSRSSLRTDRFSNAQLS